MSQNPNLPNRLIDAKERRLLVPYSDMHIWRLEREGKFPKRRKLSNQRVGWLSTEIDKWLESREPVTQQNG